MKQALFAFCLMTLPLISQASDLIDDENVQYQKNCFSNDFANYDDWMAAMKSKFQKRAKSEQQVSAKLARFDKLMGRDNFEHFKDKLECRTFRYQVDSHMVKGFMIKPKVTDKKLPVLVYNRGGNGNFGGVVFGSMMLNLFPMANKGFIIIGSQYRGTFTRSDTLDEFGGKDVNDVTTLLNFIPAIKDADADRVGMFGASRGGMQTHLAVKQSKGIKAIAVIAGDSDLKQGIINRPEMERVYNYRIPNYKDNKEAELAKRSVINWADKLSPDMPILLLHGSADKRVSVEHSKTLATALSKHNIPHKLVIYPGDNHGLMKNKAASFDEMSQWFNKYL